MSNLLLRDTHRWLGLIAGVQLLLWTVSGLYFTLIPIETIRGNHLLVDQPDPALLLNTNLISPSDLVQQHEALASLTINDIRLTQRLDRLVYVAEDAAFDGQTGESLAPLSKEEAIHIIRARTRLEPISAMKLEETAPDHEFRGGPLPVWQVQTDVENARFYVEPVSGRIRAVRTDAWRWFDFLWSLHIMDYETRDNFNHLLIQFLSVLGLLTVLSGLALFVTTEIRKRTRIRSKN